MIARPRVGPLLLLHAQCAWDEKDCCCSPLAGREQRIGPTGNGKDPILSRRNFASIAGFLVILLSMAARANDGGYDPSFASGGRRPVYVSGLHKLVGVHLREDRRILLAGRCDGFSTSGSIVGTLCAAELTADGDLTDYGPAPADTGPGAVAMTELQPQLPGERYTALDSSTDTSGRLLIAAERESGGFYRASLARISPHGDVLDGLFVRSPGLNELDDSRFQAVVADSQNRTVVAGSVRRTNGRLSLLVMRLDSDLNPDSTFGVDGNVRVDYVDRNSSVADIEIDSQGRILVFCNQYQFDSTETFNTLYRFTASGDLDATFGTTGEAVVGSTLRAIAGGLAIDSADRAVVLGTTEDLFEGDRDLYVARFLANGTPDNSFNLIPGIGGGFLLIEAEDLVSVGPNEQPGDLVIQANGKILLSATADRIGGNGSYFFSMRLLSDSSADSSYGVAGISVGTYASSPSQGYSDFGRSLALDPAGFTYFAGNSRGTNPLAFPTFGVARLNNIEATEPSLFANGFD
jgi:uncharacterized delta-60 repeat protein